MDNEAFPLYERKIVLTRPGGDDLRQPLLALIRACGEADARLALRYRARGFRRVAFKGSAEEVAAALRAQRRGQEAGDVAPFFLTSAGSDPLLTLYASAEPLSPGVPHHKVELQFRTDRHLVGPDGHFGFDALVGLFGRVVEAFGAGYGAVTDSQLMEIVNARIAVEEMKRRIPRERHHQIGRPDFGGKVPRALAQRVARVQHPLYFDIHEVPPAVWWINYWSPRQLRAVSVERVRAAPWARVLPQPSGGLILVAVDEPFDATRTDHLERIAQIVEALDLHTVQGRYLHAASS